MSSAFNRYGKQAGTDPATQFDSLAHSLQDRMNTSKWLLISLWLASCTVALGQSEHSTKPRAVTEVTKESSCERLAQLTVPGTKIAVAQSVPAGAFVAGFPAMSKESNLSTFYKSLPAFCRIVAEARPTADSDIKIEIWMPATGWNGKFQGLGNGGFAGQIDYRQLGTAVSRGYAAAATDTGHMGRQPMPALDATWALGHPEKVIDFGYRGVHEMTRISKEVTHAFYGENPRHSYFESCSNGGRQALMEAQRYPEDYDGILAGAPANFWAGLLTAGMWDTQITTSEQASYIPAGKLPAIAAAVLAACDSQDGVRDGILNDPRQCRFDPTTLICKSGDESDKCLTSAQATALKKLYEGPRDSHGRRIFPGLLPGAEDGPGGWGPWVVGQAPSKSLMASFGIGYFSNMVYGKADWDPRTFNVARAFTLAGKKTGDALNATNPDLRPFKAHGGKLILYHGWDDPAISAVNTIDYYHSVGKKIGQQDVDSFIRLFMVPGMQHCAGGPGPTSFGEDGVTVPDDPQHNVHLALEQWVERGIAPTSLIAGKYDASHQATMTRPLCPYPQFAKYKGTGDTNDATNFVCAPGSR